MADCFQLSFKGTFFKTSNLVTRVFLAKTGRFKFHNLFYIVYKVRNSLKHSKYPIKRLLCVAYYFIKILGGRMNTTYMLLPYISENKKTTKREKG